MTDIELLLNALEESKKALEFYANLIYSDKMGLPPDVQWIAENAIKEIDKAKDKVRAGK